MTLTEALSESSSGRVDIRPRVFDGISQRWCLVDTGSEVSCLPPEPGDAPRPDILLETVDGSKLKCYGKKSFNLRLNRKQYSIEAAVSDTTDIILGMDFIEI